MEVYFAALQVARLIETPSSITLDCIRKNFDLNALPADRDVLCNAPPADWIDKAEAKRKRTPSPGPSHSGGKKVCVTESLI